jgi:hypothetical protein
MKKKLSAAERGQLRRANTMARKKYDAPNQRKPKPITLPAMGRIQQREKGHPA